MHYLLSHLRPGLPCWRRRASKALTLIRSVVILMLACGIVYLRAGSTTCLTVGLFALASVLLYLGFEWALRNEVEELLYKLIQKQVASGLALRTSPVCRQP